VLVRDAVKRPVHKDAPKPGAVRALAEGEAAKESPAAEAKSEPQEPKS
jgi:hypothetical protein